jgi:hypothetical protein
MGRVATTAGSLAPDIRSSPISDRGRAAFWPGPRGDEVSEDGSVRYPMAVLPRCGSWNGPGVGVSIDVSDQFASSIKMSRIRPAPRHLRTSPARGQLQ